MHDPRFGLRPLTTTLVQPLEQRGYPCSSLAPLTCSMKGFTLPQTALFLPVPATPPSALWWLLCASPVAGQAQHVSPPPPPNRPRPFINTTQMHPQRCRDPPVLTPHRTPLIPTSQVEVKDPLPPPPSGGKKGKEKKDKAGAAQANGVAKGAPPAPSPKAAKPVAPPPPPPKPTTPLLYPSQDDLSTHTVSVQFHSDLTSQPENLMDMTGTAWPP